MKPVRVLLVDDEAELVRGLTRVLGRRGFAVEACADGASALRAAARGGVDVVLLDVKLPDMDGVEVLAGIRRAAPSLPVILMTGHLSAADEEGGLRAGAFAYVLKPHPVEELAALLRAAAGG